MASYRSLLRNPRHRSSLIALGLLLASAITSLPAFADGGKDCPPMGSLPGNPNLKLSIQGNTDNIGGHDYNVKLSQQRAAAVVATLVKTGIAADRLSSSGNGPDKPVADNDTTEGRTKNRRVDLVKS